VTLYLRPVTDTNRLAQMLEFCQTVKPSLEDYEADGVRFLNEFRLLLGSRFIALTSYHHLKAWPTLLDDFVTWKKSKTSAGNGNA